HTRSTRDWSSDVCSSDLEGFAGKTAALAMGTASGGTTTLQPQKKKLVLEYLRPRVDDRGMLVSANINEQDRHPAAHIAGPRVVRSEERRVGKERTAESRG